MYYKEIETNASAKRQHDDNHKKWAAERMKKVAAKIKAKKA